MSFTIRCGKCKSETTFEDNEILFKSNSSIKIDGSGGYDGHFSVGIECKCGNSIVEDTDN